MPRIACVPDRRNGIVTAITEFRELRRRINLLQTDFAALLEISAESCRV